MFIDEKVNAISSSLFYSLEKEDLIRGSLF